MSNTDETRAAIRSVAPTLVDQLDVHTDGDILTHLSEYGEHPLARLLRSSLPDCLDRRSEDVLVNVDQATRMIIPHSSFTKWLSSRLMTASDREDSSAASGSLGEIRALGGLLEAFPVVEPVTEGKKRTPDFKINPTDGSTPIFVEVSTKLMAESEACNLIAAGADRNGAGSTGADYLEHVTAPFGRPTKSPENMRTEVAHKICQVKDGSHQAQPGSPFVIWLDLQDADFSVIDATELDPISVGPSGELFSGGIWIGLYGKKGDPVLEHLCLQGGQSDAGALSFDGRFVRDSTVSAFLISLPSKMVLFENHMAATPIPMVSLAAILALPHFDLGRSWTRLGDNQWCLRLRVGSGTPKLIYRVSET